MENSKFKSVTILRGGCRDRNGRQRSLAEFTRSSFFAWTIMKISYSVICSLIFIIHFIAPSAYSPHLSHSNSSYIIISFKRLPTDFRIVCKHTRGFHDVPSSFLSRLISQTTLQPFLISFSSTSKSFFLYVFVIFIFVTVDSKHCAWYIFFFFGVQ